MYKKHFKIICTLVLIPIIITAIIYPNLPNEIVIRIGNDGNEYADKINIWVLNIISIVTVSILIFIGKISVAKNTNKYTNCNMKQFGLISILVASIMFYVNMIMIYMALFPENADKMCLPLVALIILSPFVVIGLMFYIYIKQ